MSFFFVVVPEPNPTYHIAFSCQITLCKLKPQVDEHVPYKMAKIENKILTIPSFDKSADQLDSSTSLVKMQNNTTLQDSLAISYEDKHITQQSNSKNYENI